MKRKPKSLRGRPKGGCKLNIRKVEAALKRSGGSKYKAAKLLAVSPQAVYQFTAKYMG